MTATGIEHYEHVWTDDNPMTICDGTLWTGHATCFDMYDHPEVYDHEGMDEVKAAKKL